MSSVVAVDPILARFIERFEGVAALAHEYGFGPIGRELDFSRVDLDRLALPHGVWKQPGPEYETLERDEKHNFRITVLQMITESLKLGSGPLTQAEIKLIIQALTSAKNRDEVAGTDSNGSIKKGNSDQRIGIVREMIKQCAGHLELAERPMFFCAVAIHIAERDHGTALEICERRSIPTEDIEIGTDRLKAWLEKMQQSGKRSEFKPTVPTSNLLIKHLVDVGVCAGLRAIENPLRNLTDAVIARDEGRVCRAFQPLQKVLDTIRPLVRGGHDWYESHPHEYRGVYPRKAPDYKGVDIEAVRDAFYGWVASGGRLEIGEQDPSAVAAVPVKDVLKDWEGERLFAELHDFAIRYCRANPDLQLDQWEVIFSYPSDLIYRVRDYINRQTGQQISKEDFVPYLVLLGRANICPTVAALEFSTVSDGLRLTNPRLVVDAVKRFSPEGNTHACGVGDIFLRERGLDLPWFRSQYLGELCACEYFAGRPVFALGPSYEILQHILPPGVELKGTADQPTPELLKKVRLDLAGRETPIFILDGECDPISLAALDTLTAIPSPKAGYTSRILIGSNNVYADEIGTLRRRYGYTVIGGGARMRVSLQDTLDGLFESIIHAGRNNLNLARDERYKGLVEFSNMTVAGAPLAKPGQVAFYCSMLDSIQVLTHWISSGKAKRQTQNPTFQQASAAIRKYDRLSDTKEKLIALNHDAVAEMVQETMMPEYSLRAELEGKKLWTGYAADEYSEYELFLLYQQAYRQVQLSFITKLSALPLVKDHFRSLPTTNTVGKNVGDSYRRNWDLIQYFHQISRVRIGNLLSTSLLMQTVTSETPHYKSQSAIYVTIGFKGSTHAIADFDAVKTVSDRLHAMTLAVLCNGNPKQSRNTPRPIEVIVNSFCIVADTPGQNWIIPISQLVTAFKVMDRLRFDTADRIDGFHEKF